MSTDEPRGGDWISAKTYIIVCHPFARGVEGWGGGGWKGRGGSRGEEGRSGGGVGGGEEQARCRRGETHHFERSGRERTEAMKVTRAERSDESRDRTPTGRLWEGKELTENAFGFHPSPLSNSSASNSISARHLLESQYGSSCHVSE